MIAGFVSISVTKTNNDAKWRAVESRLPGSSKLDAGSEKVNLGDVEAPEPPLAHDDHFKPDAKTSASVDVSDPMNFAYNQDHGVSGGEGQHQPLGPEAAADVENPVDVDMFMPDSPEEAMDDSESMQFSLIAAGCDVDAAKVFVEKVFGVSGATTFIEMYGKAPLSLRQIIFVGRSI